MQIEEIDDSGENTQINSYYQQLRSLQSKIDQIKLRDKKEDT